MGHGSRNVTTAEAGGTVPPVVDAAGVPRGEERAA